MLTWGPQGLGPQEARPHARGSHLEVHTELFVYVGASRRSCQLFVYVGALLGPDLGVAQNPHSLYYSVANCILQMLNFLNADLFATHFNHKLSLYVSPVLDSQAFVIDALFMNWNALHTYAFPPIVLMYTTYSNHNSSILV